MRCAGFSLSWLLLLQSTGSRHAGLALSCCTSLAGAFPCWQTVQRVAFLGLRHAFRLQALSAGLRLPLPPLSGPQLFPFPPAPLYSSQDSAGSSDSRTQWRNESDGKGVWVMNRSLVYWDGGSGKTGRGRGASELEGTLAEYVGASTTPSHQQDLRSSKEVFCLHFSIFKVDKPAPSCLRGRLAVFAWPLNSLLLHWPWQ